MYKIEKDIPVPASRCKYPYRLMEIGDSIFIPNADIPPSGSYPSASYFSKRNPEYKFTIRRVKGGYRTWRIECKQ